MRMTIKGRAKHLCVTLLLVVWWGGLFAQPQAERHLPQLTIKSEPNLKAFLHEPYHHQLDAQGGIAPYVWKLAAGSLPRGISLDPSGALDGSPTQIGDFHFVLTVSDSARPPHERNHEFVLHVLEPLLVQWSNPARVSGQRIEGSIKVSNPTNKDVDLTAIVLAVNEIGRATALGYQHFTLRRDTIDLEIPFGGNLPRGAYEVNVDVVAENTESNTIRRARLVTPQRLQVAQGP